MYRILLAAILSLAFILRIYHVGENPPAVYGDEIAFAWNAYSVMKTGADEYGVFYPLQFRSFDDYKAPIPVYYLIPFIKIFGLNAFSIRLSVVVAAVATVWLTYLLVSYLISKKIALLAAFLLAISPWHMHLSRGFFEATLALFPFILGIYFYLKSQGRTVYLAASVIAFAVSLYTYFTPRILVPIFLIFLLLFYRHKARLVTKKKIAVFLIAFLVLILPLIKMSLLDKGAARFEKLQRHKLEKIEEIVNQERFTSDVPMPWKRYLHNKVTIWLRQLKNNYLEHFSLNFWFLYGDNSLRYFTGNMGMFYLIELPFFLIGAYYLSKHYKEVAVLFWGWLLLAPIPAALVGRSFAVRSIALLPAPFFATSLGLQTCWDWINKHSYPLRLTSLLLILGYIITLGSQLLTYHLEYPNYAATWWGWENKAAIDYGLKRQDKYDHIFISNFYTGAPMAFAFYTQFDPQEYREAINNPVRVADRELIKMGKFYFGSLDLDKKRIEQGVVPPHSLYLGRPEEADGAGTINSPSDNRVLFKIHIFP